MKGRKLMDDMSNPTEADTNNLDEYPRISAYLYEKDKEEGKEFLRGIILKKTIDTREEYTDILMAFGKILPFKNEDHEIPIIIAELEKLFPSLTRSIPEPHSWWTRLLELRTEPREGCDVEWPVK
jgi:hypothetical protein